LDALPAILNGSLPDLLQQRLNVGGEHNGMSVLSEDTGCSEPYQGESRKWISSQSGARERFHLQILSFTP
jgi:hypothetical protein